MGTRAIAIVLLSMLVLAACGLRDVDLTEPEPQPTVTVTVTETVTPEPEPAPEPDVPDPCEDPPTGTDLIFVSAPASGWTVESPFMVTGCSSTFEANVVWELLDGDGEVLAEGFTMGGSLGQPEGFSIDVAYNIDEEVVGSLRVYETSAEDGSELHVNTIPLVLAP